MNVQVGGGPREPSGSCDLLSLASNGVPPDRIASGQRVPLPVLLARDSVNELHCPGLLVGEARLALLLGVGGGESYGLVAATGEVEGESEEGGEEGRGRVEDD